MHRTRTIENHYNKNYNICLVRVSLLNTGNLAWSETITDAYQNTELGTANNFGHLNSDKIYCRINLNKTNCLDQNDWNKFTNDIMKN
jgi:hypothetical protein